ncbi:hypothetical protein Tco_1002277 [Tanacetum coccineum]|uniref:Uncharacterized protein n=1 Tax=Tanacetum coccineum TaxID=301880 RepID=A0ABQ5F6X2_9ASTR
MYLRYPVSKQHIKADDLNGQSPKLERFIEVFDESQIRKDFPGRLDEFSKLRDFCVWLGSGCLTSILIIPHPSLRQINEGVIGVACHVVVAIVLRSINLAHLHSIRHIPANGAMWNVQMVDRN